MARQKLDSTEVAEMLATLEGWSAAKDSGSISREFQFRNFSEAFGFMTRVAMLAEKLDHHPEWSNVYKTVNVTLSTHDAGGLTELDFKMAAGMDKFARSAKA